MNKIFLGWLVFMKALILPLFFLLVVAKITYAKVPEVGYETIIESKTQVIINQINKDAKLQQIANKSINEIVIWVSMQLLNSPYEFYLLDNKVPEYLYISLTKTDCMLLVEEVVILSRLIKANQLNLANYIEGIKKIRYHGNVSYCNRNHYFKDWVVMNENQHWVEDIGFKLTGVKLPYTAHILGDVISKNESNIHFSDLACIREREKIVNKEQLGFIPINNLPYYLKYIKSGDIVGVVVDNPVKSDSIKHVGIAYINNGEVKYLNASSKKENMKVVIYDSLIEYLKLSKAAGIVLIRVNS